ncbi:hypothetical protein [Sandaracinus amylolyticus]|uniref:hypothetical protein n=1 Tax=Sandaracinus amylolyticus TaxID=927083 RepID=UPI001F268F54|nr:hypothetical protein [Sandaracinus amylolyticus]UJR80063.1 Hypothetical protein I5071_21070 [Sandaracinus amylolyticus]
MHKGGALVAGTLSLLVAACGEGGGSTPRVDGSVPLVGDDAAVTTPPPPPPPPPGPVDCAAGPVASFAGTVQALADRRAIAGARVCVLDHPEIPCVATNAEGFYVLGCAPIGDAAISFEADGFASGVWLWRGVAGEPTDLSVLLARDSENTGYLAPTGVTYPDGSSALVTIDANGAVEGLTARLRSGSGHGAFYSADDGGRIDPSATFLADESELVFFVARPWEGWGELEVELIAPGRTCAQTDGAWQARDGAPNAVRVPVRPDTETVIWITCE